MQSAECRIKGERLDTTILGRGSAPTTTRFQNKEQKYPRRTKWCGGVVAFILYNVYFEILPSVQHMVLTILW